MSFKKSTLRKPSVPVSSPLQVLGDQNVPFLLSSAYKTELNKQQQAFKGVLNISRPVQEDKLLSALGCTSRQASCAACL
jgi:hypothetical protein